MPNPLSPLQDALKVLCVEAEILPATGQATTDMVMPDLEEIYDRQTGGMATVDGIWEVPSSSLYRAVQPIHRKERHLLRFFIDGSAFTYFIGTVIEQERSSPVQLSQVGAAVVHRQDDGQIKIANLAKSILLTLERKVLSEDLWSGIEQAMNNLEEFELCDSATNNVFADEMDLQEARPRGAHRANWHMRELERNLASNIPRDSDSWLVIDGSLGNEYEDWRGPPVIGVAKTFRRDNRFELGRGPRKRRLSLFGLLKDLDENQRTIVFSRKRRDGSNEGKILFWYVRIRPQKGLDYPLMGVVKVEMPNPSQEPVCSDRIDEISGCLVAERHVAPHGRGWALARSFVSNMHCRTRDKGKILL